MDAFQVRCLARAYFERYPARSLRGRCILGMRITRGGILGALYATPWFNCFPFAVRLRARDDYRRFGLSANARCHTNC